MSGISRKTRNRVKELVGTLSVGERVDLGRPHQKGYRLALGRTASGTSARIWLGLDEAEAQQRAQAYIAVWADLVSQGRTHWTPDLMAQAKDLAQNKVETFRTIVHTFAADATHLEKAAAVKRAEVELLAGKVTQETPADTGSRQAQLGSRPTLYGAVAAFLESLGRKRVSESHRWRATQVLDRSLKHCCNDIPISDINYPWLDSLADHFKSRPDSRRNSRGLSRPIRPQTVKTTLAYLRQFFTWMDDSQYGGWEAPRKFSKPFRVRLDDLRTPAEIRLNREIAQFDVNSLVQLYRAANDRQRAMMLAAIFTAATQRELAVLEKAEVDFVANKIDHARNKTGVRGVFWIPDELVSLLKQEFARHPQLPLAFYTERGRPLVVFSSSKLISDSVAQMWVDLRAKAGLTQALSFKYLRKFAGDFATRHGGEAMGQVMLSHAPTSVLGKHYSTARDFEGLHRIQQQLYHSLKEAGMFALLPADAAA